eukprot:m.418669 g.418669  ORF g.418669 m.418669 type:complete len:656 (+) comp21293_c0_seq13:336-2303(+)
MPSARSPTHHSARMRKNTIIPVLLLQICSGAFGGGTCRQAAGIPGKQLTCMGVSPQHINTSLGSATTNVSIGFFSDLDGYSFCALVYRWLNGTTSSQDFNLPLDNGTIIWGNTTYGVAEWVVTWPWRSAQGLWECTQVLCYAPPSFYPVLYQSSASSATWLLDDATHVHQTGAGDSAAPSLRAVTYTPTHTVLRAATVVFNVSFADGTTDTAGLASLALTIANPDGATTTYTWPAVGNLVAGTPARGVVQFVTEPLDVRGQYNIEGLALRDNTGQSHCLQWNSCVTSSPPSLVAAARAEFALVFQAPLNDQPGFTVSDTLPPTSTPTASPTNSPASTATSPSTVASTSSSLLGGSASPTTATSPLPGTSSQPLTSAHVDVSTTIPVATTTAGPVTIVQTTTTLTSVPPTSPTPSTTTPASAAPPSVAPTPATPTPVTATSTPSSVPTFPSAVPTAIPTQTPSGGMTTTMPRSTAATEAAHNSTVGPSALGETTDSSASVASVVAVVGGALVLVCVGVVVAARIRRRHQHPDGQNVDTDEWIATRGPGLSAHDTTPSPDLVLNAYYAGSIPQDDRAHELLSHRPTVRRPTDTTQEVIEHKGLLGAFVDGTGIGTALAADAVGVPCEGDTQAPPRHSLSSRISLNLDDFEPHRVTQS